ncbi:hypothetical protein [Roseovarius albus]|nr:hypothetical protein [Roseovarius albus]
MTAHPAARAALLACAGGARSDATLGDVDRAAWQFLQDQFGKEQAAVLTCSACDTDVEFTLPGEFAPPKAKSESSITFRCGDQKHNIRLPRLSDLLGRAFDPVCLAPEGDWANPQYRAAAEAALVSADPGLTLELNLSCAACGADQTQRFDVTGFVWTRLEQAAKAIVRDVASLAQGYGWSEAEITGMSAARRAIYLRELGE